MKTWFVNLSVFSICLLLSHNLSATNSEETISVYATSVVKRNGGNPQQVGIIEIADRTMKNIDVVLAFPDTEVKLRFDNLEDIHYRVPFYFPVLEKRTNVNVLVKQGERTLINKVIEFLPPKIWKIYDVQVSHHDLGYADYYYMMRRDVREMGTNSLPDARK